MSRRQQETLPDNYCKHLLNISAIISPPAVTWFSLLPEHRQMQQLLLHKSKCVYLYSTSSFPYIYCNKTNQFISQPWNGKYPGNTWHQQFRCWQIYNQTMKIQGVTRNFFLPEASFGLRVLSLPASVCVNASQSVCPSVLPSVHPSRSFCAW